MGSDGIGNEGSYNSCNNNTDQNNIKNFGVIIFALALAIAALIPNFKPVVLFPLNQEKTENIQSSSSSSSSSSLNSLE